MALWRQLQFGHISDVLQTLGAAGNAAEGHGILCGLLCSRGYVNGPTWMIEMTRQHQPEGSERPAGPYASEDSLPAPLIDLHSETVRGINDANYDFHLMLPDDEEDLETRVAALTQWCNGFLYGLGIGGIKNLSALPESVSEITHDLLEISKTSTATDGSEEDESAFTELVEYIRVGVQLIYEELQPVPTKGDPRPGPTLH